MIKLNQTISQINKLLKVEEVEVDSKVMIRIDTFFNTKLDEGKVNNTVYLSELEFSTLVKDLVTYELSRNRS